MNDLRKKYLFGPCEYDFTKRTFIMGVLNVTPDSFSDGGRYFDSGMAVKRGLEMIEEGADFIDVGGESTRPGAEQISIEEELRRVLPVIRQLARTTKIPVSIDTCKSAVAEGALSAGATMVNDISGLHFDPMIADAVAKHEATIILMHIRGTPRTMQTNPEYQNVIEDICSYIEDGIQLARQKGINQIIVDPGIGFGKSTQHNLEIINKLREFKRFGYPVLVGPSRKSFIGKILDVDVEDRFEGTAAAVSASIIKGANIVRVHDVKQMKRIAQMTDAISRA